jgi:hypothetical protein
MAQGGKIRYQVPLTCRCGRSGVATYEENESPPHHAPSNGHDDRKLLDIEGEFTPGVGDDPSIYCVCGAKVS